MMKRLLKRGIKALWRGMEPLRRPILRKIELFLRRCLQPNEQALLGETDVLMDHVIRELVRLQCQVEALEQTIVELLPAHAQEVPAIAGEIEPPYAPDGQLKAG
jgi:hypothetical protein